MSKDKVHLPLVKLPTGKEHVSFSELAMWDNCTWAHKLAQIDKLNKYQQNPHASFGTAVHAALEDYLKTRVMNTQIAIDMIREIWIEARKNPPADLSPKDLTKFLDVFGEEDITTPRGRVIVQGQERWEKQALNILAEVPAWLDETFPKWEFVESEHKLYEPIEGFNNAFKGFIDGVITCLDKRGKKRITWLIDWKTSTSGWFKQKKQDPMVKNQIILYKKFWCQKNPDINVKDVRCAFVILKRLGKPLQLCDFFPVSAGPVTIARSEKLIRNMIVSLNRGVAIKNRTACKWCDYFDTEHCDSVFRYL